MRIDAVRARSIPDTRGRPTVETTLSTGSLSVTASVPSGKSTGSHEAFELRDPDGGVARAVGNVESDIAEALVGREFASADEVDTLLIELDGTPDKSRLGANALLSVSVAATRLFALQEGVPLWKAITKRASGGKRFFESVPSAVPLTAGRNALEKSFSTASSSPRLFVNVMNGGVHADFKLPFQEYMLVVEGRASNALPIAKEAFAKLGERLGAGVPMGDEGGYAPTFDTLEKPFEILAELVQEFPGASIAIDAAASEFFHNGSYTLLGTSHPADDLAALYRELVERFPLHSIEDPFAEDAHADFASLTATLGGHILVVGDDLTVTTPARIKEAAANKEINAVLIKPNQIGTVREALLAVQETSIAGWQAICSHRSGETGDTFIADFAYGVGAYGIKAGGLGQKERLLKYERSLAIEREAETR